MRRRRHHNPPRQRYFNPRRRRHHHGVRRPSPVERSLEAKSLDNKSVHPLLLPDIIEDILSHLSSREVEKCRLVSQLWNKEACKVLRRKRVIVFLDANAVKIYNDNMRETNDYPHAQFEFCCQDCTGIVDSSIKDFWHLFGQYIRRLEFRHPHVFWHDLFEILDERVPYLEKLALRHLPRLLMRSKSGRHSLPSVRELYIASIPSAPSIANKRMTDLLKALPNLELIKILPIEPGPMRARVSTVLVDALRKPDVNLRQLRCITLNMDMTSDGMDGLAKKKLSLEKIQMTIPDGIKATSFKDFLCSLRPKLTELNITFPDSFSNYQSFVTHNNLMKPEECVQIMSNLHTLKMTNFRGSIRFIQRMKKLENLDVATPTLDDVIPLGFHKNGLGPTTCSFDENEEHCLKRLKVMATSPTVKKVDTLTIESLSKCFPFLNRIQLQAINDDGLGIMYRNLPFLTELDILKSNCTDQGLTGIPLEVCHDMLETCTLMVVQPERYRRDLFIGSLQFLRRFSVNAPKITDAALILGLADCKHLKELKLGSPNISDTGIIFMTDRFHKQLNYMDLSECTEITEQSKFYAREKLVGALKVNDPPSESQIIQTKMSRKEARLNSDRLVVRQKKGQNIFGRTMALAHCSEFYDKDARFFEENSAEDLQDRSIFQISFLPSDEVNRVRVRRIRDALRRGGSFLRSLQRMGLYQFRKLYRREIKIDKNADFAERQRFYRRRAKQFASIDEMDRLPENYRSEIYRVGLRLEDVEYMLHHRFLFEAAENVHHNARNNGRNNARNHGHGNVRNNGNGHGHNNGNGHGNHNNGANPFNGRGNIFNHRGNLFNNNVRGNALNGRGNVHQRLGNADDRFIFNNNAFIAERFILNNNINPDDFFLPHHARIVDHIIADNQELLVNRLIDNVLEREFGIENDELPDIDDRPFVRLHENPIVVVDENPIAHVDDNQIDNVDELPVAEVEENPIEHVDEHLIAQIEEHPIADVDENLIPHFAELAIAPADEHPVVQVNDDPAGQVNDDPALQVNDDPAVQINDDPAVQVNNNPVVLVNDQLVVRVNNHPIANVNDQPIVENDIYHNAPLMN